MKRYVFILIILILGSSDMLAKGFKEPESYSYLRGKEAFEDNNLQDALNWFEKEIKEHPDNGCAYVYMAIIRSDNEEYGKAFSAVNQAIKYLPAKDKYWTATALGVRAAINLAMTDTVAALQDYASAIKADPTEKALYRNRGDLYHDLEEYDLSDADFKKIIELDKGDPVGYVGVGRNAGRQGRWDDALRQFDYLVRLEPEYSSGYALRAAAYIELKKWNEATDDIVKALGIDGNESAYNLLIMIKGEGRSILRSKLKVKMAKSPQEQLWPYCLGLMAVADENYDEAIEYYTKCNSIDANPMLLRYIGDCMKYKYDYESALDYYERALNMGETDGDLVLEIGNILSMLGRTEECLKMRDRYVELDPENPVAYLTRGVDLESSGKYKEALEDFDTASALSPQIGNMQYFVLKRARAIAGLGNQDEANAQYLRIIDPDNGLRIVDTDYTAYAYLALGDTVKAIESMNVILSNDTTDGFSTIYNAACLYARVGDRAKALEYLKQAIEKGAPVGHALQDADLESLRNEPEFKSLIDEHTSGGSKDKEAESAVIETVEIPFTKESGVTKVKCAINGLPLYFVFDTGAADVTMSMVEANFMLKNDYVKPSDVIGSALYVDANGDISEGTVINLKNVDFGGLQLENVRASVVRNQKAPLLLGQSVLGRLGKIQIDNNDMKLIISHKVYK